MGKEKIDGVEPRDIYERVRSEVEKHGTSGRQMCIDLDMALSVYWNLSQYYPGVGTLYKISKYFNVSMEYLCDGTKPNSIYEELTDNERELLFLFRSMSEAGRSAVIQQAKALKLLDRNGGM